MSKVRQPRSRFRFSDDAIAELNRALGSSAASVIPDLQALVASWRAGATGEWQVFISRNEGNRMLTALRLILQRIDEASPAMRELMGVGTLSDLTPGRPMPDHLGVFRAHATRCMKALEGRIAFDDRYVRRRGRRRNVLRESEANAIALLLRLNGVRVTTSRNGQFAKVLTSVLFEIDGKAPDDMFRLIKRCSQWVNETDLNHLRAFFTEIRGDGLTSSFWTEVLSRPPAVH